MWAKNPNGEADIGVGYADGKYLYLWGDTTTGGRGIWDSNKGHIISVSESGGTSFNGTATLADALTTSAGSSNRPVYFSGGKPYACSGETVFAYGNDGWNCNTIYNASLYCIGSGSNCPSGSQYGALFTMPYRQPSGNTEPGYAGQIFLPNGDDGATPDGLYYRTSMSSSYRNWKSVIHSNSKKYYGSQTDMTNSTGANEGDVFFVIG